MSIMDFHLRRSQSTTNRDTDGNVLSICVRLMLHQRVPPIVHKCFLASGIHTHAMHSPGVFQRSHDLGLH
jgi:hypothetical protein